MNFKYKKLNINGKLVNADSGARKSIECPGTGNVVGEIAWADTERAVKATKFNPDGNRRMCRYVRSSKYSSRKKEDYFSEANEEMSIIIQIEGVEGVSNLSEILEVDHVDVTFIGPYDLSQSLGLPGDIHNQKVLNQMQKVVKEATKKSVEVGSFVETSRDAKLWVDVGVKYISYSVDVGIFYDTCQNIVQNLNHK